VKIILEVKGFETEQDRQKGAAARRWVRAVNHHGEFGRWAFALCKDPGQLSTILVREIEVLCGIRI
jgi:type III restriction enzyme